MNKGFTVVELVVSTGIIIVILGMLFMGYPRFKARSALSALAREVAITVREAQVYGLAVKQLGNEFPSYGIHISADKPKEIVLFGDYSSGDREDIYDSGKGCGSNQTETECIRRITMIGQEYVEKICVNPGGAQETEEVCDIPELNITFKRPDPEAIIITDDNSVRYNAAKIYLRSSKDSREQRVVRVWITGQTSVQ
ncbi:MAG: type II secretion system protein [Patescibacteria group bacterium]